MSETRRISSSKNPLVKKITKISKSQSFRNKSGLTLLEGAHLTGEYLRVFGEPEMCIISDDTSLEAKAIVKECGRLGVDIYELAHNIYSQISPVIDGVGISFVIKIPTCTDINYNTDSVILDKIQDPGNLGTILRSAVGTGVGQIICSKGTVSAWSPKVLRAGMGAHFRLKIFEQVDILQEIDNISTPIYATSLTAKEYVHHQHLKSQNSWIFGNEGNGVSEDILQKVNKKVIIPQLGDIESLNVAMAATICLYEQMRQRL